MPKGRSVREIFDAILDRYEQDPARWEEAVREFCAGDEHLAAEVRQLLEAYRSAQREGFLERPVMELLADTPGQAPPTLSVGLEDTHLESVGPYQVKRLLGSGGFSSVYLAEQREPIHREVALKVFRWSGGPEAHSLIARFLQEREVLALMDHPNIAHIYEGGVLPDGRPFYAMELVRAGRPMSKFCDDLRLSISDRLELFLELCSAIQHAHQKGVIHRDLKPANVLAYEEDGRPRVKVIDFGLAKALQRRLGPQTVETMLGAFFGTPAYMAPEQAGGDPLRIDTRADIYSLGAILYELLTGLTPLDLSGADGGLVGQVEIIRHREPIRPSQRVLQEPGAEERAACRGTTPAGLAHCLRGDLDWIVLKCLEKEPGRRYPSVGALMEDISRYRRHEPIMAAPPSWTYRMRKFTRRYRGLLAAVGAVILALGLGLVGSTWGFLEARRQAAQAQRQRLEAEQARQIAENARIAAEKAAQAEHQARLEAQRQQKEAEYQREQAELERQKAQTAAAQAQAARQQAERRLEQVRRSNQILAEIFEELDIRKIKESQEPVEAVLAKRLVQAAGQLEEESVGDPLEVAYLQATLATSLLSLGYPKEAARLFEKVLATRQAHLGPDHPDTLASMHNLALTYQDAGQVEKALPLLEETLKLQRAKLGPDHPHTLRSMNNLAVAYQDAGQVEKALPLHEETLKLQRAKLGPDHPDTLGSMHNLAVAYRRAGQVEKALPLHEETLKLRRAKLGPDHPDTLASMHNLAVAYREAGELEKALPLLEETLKLRRAKLGPDHPDTLASMNNLALTYLLAGQVEKALPLLEETLKLQRAKLGPDHPDTLTSMHNLAVAYRRAGQVEKALPLWAEAMEGMEKHKFTIPIADLAVPAAIRAYEEAKQFDRAEAWRRKWLAVIERRSGAKSMEYADELAGLGWNLLQQRKWAEAEKVLRECLHIRQEKRPDHWSTDNTRSMLGGALLGQKRYPEAEPLLREGYQGLKDRADQIPPEARKRILEAVDRLVELYTALGKPEDVKKWQTERETWVKQLPEKEPKKE